MSGSWTLGLLSYLLRRCLDVFRVGAMFGSRYLLRYDWSPRGIKPPCPRHFKVDPRVPMIQGTRVELEPER